MHTLLKAPPLAIREYSCRCCGYHKYIEQNHSGAHRFLRAVACAPCAAAAEAADARRARRIATAGAGCHAHCRGRSQATPTNLKAGPGMVCSVSSLLPSGSRSRRNSPPPLGQPQKCRGLAPSESTIDTTLTGPHLKWLSLSGLRLMVTRSENVDLRVSDGR